VEEAGEDLPIPLAQVADLTQSDGHINFFQDLEDGKKLNSEINKEHEEEKKKEQEDYEKKIGYLVYLGQNSLEQTKDRPWYESSSVAHPSVSQAKAASETSSSDPAHLKMTKFKEFEDPLKDIRKYLSTPAMKKIVGAPGSSKKRKLDAPPQAVETNHKKKKEHKQKHKSHKSKKRKSKGKKKRSRRESRDSSSGSETDSGDNEDKNQLDQLRAERLEREREERRKADKLMATLRGDPVEEPRAAGPPLERRAPVMKQKYNSQFNPQLARQNFDD